MFETLAHRSEGTAATREAAAHGSQPNCLAGMIAVEDILLDVEAATRDGVFNAIARSIGPRHGLNAQDVVAGLAGREELGSTALGQGVAIPHARLTGLARARVAFVRLHTAIPFAAPDGKPVSSLLILLVPEEATDAHLELLAQAANMFCAKAFRDRLNACTSAPEVLEALTGWPSETRRRA